MNKFVQNNPDLGRNKGDGSKKWPIIPACMCASEEERASTCLVCSMVGWQTLCTALVLKMGFALNATLILIIKSFFFGLNYAILSTFTL